MNLNDILIPAENGELFYIAPERVLISAPDIDEAWYWLKAEGMNGAVFESAVSVESEAEIGRLLKAILVEGTLDLGGWVKVRDGEAGALAA